MVRRDGHPTAFTRQRSSDRWGLLRRIRRIFRLLAQGNPSTCSLTDAAHSMQLAEATQNHYSGQLPPLVIE
jgi:hypothetical protein